MMQAEKGMWKEKDVNKAIPNETLLVAKCIPPYEPKEIFGVKFFSGLGRFFDSENGFKKVSQLRQQALIKTLAENSSQNLIDSKRKLEIFIPKIRSDWKARFINPKVGVDWTGGKVDYLFDSMRRAWPHNKLRAACQI